MIEAINETVSVISIYNRDAGTVRPYRFQWQGRTYTVEQIGYYHVRNVGRLREHVFDVVSGAMAFRLVCDPITLHWIG